MIEEARILEYSGPLLALLKWASMMKQFILYTIFCNVLVLPWGCRSGGAARSAPRRRSLRFWPMRFLLVALAVVAVETGGNRDCASTVIRSRLPPRSCWPCWRSSEPVPLAMLPTGLDPLASSLVAA